MGQEDLLEKETATHSSILAGKIPGTEEPGGLQSMVLQKNWPRLGVTLGQILSFPLPRFPFYKMETSIVTSVQGGGKEHTAMLQLVLTAEKVLLHSLSNTECPPHARCRVRPLRTE